MGSSRIESMGGWNAVEVALCCLFSVPAVDEIVDVLRLLPEGTRVQYGRVVIRRWREDVHVDVRDILVAKINCHLWVEYDRVDRETLSTLLFELIEDTLREVACERR